MKNTIKKYALAFFAFAMIGTAANAQGKETTTLGGYVMGFDSKTECGCIFVDKEMVKQGIAKDISNQTNKECSLPKYGLGAIICFDEVPTDADYKTPKESTLMSFTGRWVTKEGKMTFVVSSFEPFF